MMCVKAAINIKRIMGEIPQSCVKWHSVVGENLIF